MLFNFEVSQRLFVFSVDDTGQLSDILNDEDEPKTSNNQLYRCSDTTKCTHQIHGIEVCLCHLLLNEVNSQMYLQVFLVLEQLIYLWLQIQFLESEFIFLDISIF